MCTWRLTFVVTLSCCITAFCSPASAGPFDWTETPFDNAGHFSALALWEHMVADPPGQVRIEARFVTVNPHTQGLDYHFLDQVDNWLQETIDDNGAADRVALAVDSSGNPHVAYTNSTYKTSNYATKSLTLLWIINYLKSSSAGTPLQPSIDTFPDGEAAATSAIPDDNIQIDFLLAATRSNIQTRVLSAPKIRCFSDQSACVNVITKDEGLHAYVYDPISDEWTDDNVEASDKDIAHFTKVVGALMENRRFVTVTLDPDEGEKFEVYGPGNSFVVVDDLAAPDEFIQAIDLAEDNDGHLYIAWCSYDAVGITWEGSSWHTDIVDDNFTWDGGNIEIEVDSLGRVHLTYYDGNDDALVYALGTPIPEPATVVLLFTGLSTLTALRRRRRLT